MFERLGESIDEATQDKFSWLLPTPRIMHAGILLV